MSVKYRAPYFWIKLSYSLKFSHIYTFTKKRGEVNNNFFASYFRYYEKLLFKRIVLKKVVSTITCMVVYTTYTPDFYTAMVFRKTKKVLTHKMWLVMSFTL